MSNSVTMKVGFIGLGRMGRGMARRIFGAGHDLVVYDVVREATAEFASAGARVAASIADVCRERDVVVTMLVEDATVLDVALNKGGCEIHLLRAPSIWPWEPTEWRQSARWRPLTARRNKFSWPPPVLGRPDLAASGQLGIVPAGPPSRRAMRPIV
jgi:3-hydroxyisobutyrate dehydrogenase-like beta-hydroxyacid dehydrogenase